MTKLLPCNEWADKLALKTADVAPNERAALEAHLAICPGCSATYADYQTLMARLRALPRPALPPLTSVEFAVLDTAQEGGQADGLYRSVEDDGQEQPEREIPPPIRLAPRRRGTWSRWLGAVAAVLLLTVLVGPLVLLLINRQAGVSASPFTIRSGWTTIAEYSGTGSKTMRGLGLTLPYLYGLSFTCTGSGKVTTNATGPHYIGGLGAGPCASAPTSMLSPQSITLFNSGNTDEIDTLKVTAQSDTHWYIQVLQAVPQPAKLGPEWAYGGIGVGGIGSSSATSEGGISGLNGQLLQVKTWGVVFTCIGTGTGYVQFTPDIGKLSIPPCDGQAHLIKAHYPSPTRVDTMWVFITGDVNWSAQPVGCIDEQKCGG